MRLLLASFAVILLLMGCKKEEKNQDPAPPKVHVVKVAQDNVGLEKEFVGQVYGKVDIPIRARVEGFLEGIHFEEGRPVKKDQLLYSIDPDPFLQAVAAAESNVAAANTELTRASNDLDRIRPLAEMNALSQRDLDAAVANKEAAEAMVDAANAGLRAERIRLGYTKLYSPINGVIGKTNAKIGEFVGREPNPVILNTVSRVDSIRVEFFITEGDYLQLAKELRKERAEGKNQNRKQEALKLILSDGSVFEEDGYVDFVDRSVGEATGSVLIQSSFPNPDKLIKPGQFARVRVVVENVENGLLIPQRSVSEFQGNFFVLKVDENNKVEQAKVEITGPYKDYYLINSGLNKEDRIVFESIQQVKSGMIISPVDTVFKSQFDLPNE
jgi:membrane fusion protein (multidrug efflux system)